VPARHGEAESLVARGRRYGRGIRGFSTARKDVGLLGCSRSPQAGCLLSRMEKAGMKAEETTCGFCGGQGHDPFGVFFEGSTCCVCGGRGRVWVATPHIPCAHCRGSGAVKNLTCTVCGGKGAVPAWPRPDTACPECQGSGDDPSAGALSCLACRGSGRIATGTQSFASRITSTRPEPKAAIAEGIRRHEHAT
jgi:hypothetical protein